MTVVGDEDVRRLQAAVDEAAAVDGAERIGQLRRRCRAADRRAADVPAIMLVERPPLEQLADQERLAVLLARFVHRADVRMGDQRRDARLAAEAARSRPAAPFPPAAAA